MKREVLFQSSHSIISYDNRHFMYGEYFGYMESAQWKEAGMTFVNFIHEKRCNRVLLDHSAVKGTFLPLIHWGIEELIPRLIGNESFKIAFIRSTDETTARSVDRFIELSAPYFDQVSYQLFEDESIAVQWLLDQPISDKGSKNLELLPVLVDGRHKVISTEDIYYLWIKGNIVHIVTKEKTYSTRSTLTSMLQLLPPDFQQSHRGYIINLKKLDSISYYAGGSYMAYLKDFPNLRLSVGRKYAPLVKKKLGIKKNW